MKPSIKYIFAVVGLVMLLTIPAAATFADVEETDWFYGELQLMVDSGIVSGYEDGTFRPYNTVTTGEVSKMLYLFWGYDPLENGTSHWADNYAQAFDAFSWLEDMPQDLDQAMTRMEVAEAILASIGALPDTNVDNPFADVDSAVASTLFDMGILNGTVSEATGERTLSPNDPITRAEFCALLDRTYRYMAEDYGVTDFRYLLPQVALLDEGDLTQAYFYNLFLSMLVKGDYQYDIVVHDTTATALAESGIPLLANETFWTVHADYHELGAFFDNIGHTFRSQGDTTIWTVVLGDQEFAPEDSVAHCQTFLVDVGYLAQEIYDSGALDPTASDYDKAEYLYIYCAQNFAYDTKYDPANYNGYGMLQNGVGICQAYVSVYNALCKMWGVDIVGVTGTVNGGNHIWSYADLDGTWYYIDPTFGDPTPDKEGRYDENYFAVTYEELSKTHTFSE